MAVFDISNGSQWLILFAICCATAVGSCCCGALLYYWGAASFFEGRRQKKVVAQKSISNPMPLIIDYDAINKAQVSQTPQTNNDLLILRAQRMAAAAGKEATETRDSRPRDSRMMALQQSLMRKANFSTPKVNPRASNNNQEFNKDLAMLRSQKQFAQPEDFKQNWKKERLSVEIESTRFHGGFHNTSDVVSEASPNFLLKPRISERGLQVQQERHSHSVSTTHESSPKLSILAESSPRLSVLAKANSEKLNLEKPLQARRSYSTGNTASLERDFEGTNGSLTIRDELARSLQAAMQRGDVGELGKAIETALDGGIAESDPLMQPAISRLSQLLTIPA
eukprot:gb/GEZN01006739.1/.p1 GENE.gb/GEZN01006739.1/~~gb/GEZN01006739.1/.p1  ORF type:complete len:338 (-),score=43.80 gb/GEZN01006739.1/:186-1199(-)